MRTIVITVTTNLFLLAAFFAAPATAQRLDPMGAIRYEKPAKELAEKAAQAGPPSANAALRPPVEAALPGVRSEELDRIEPQAGLQPIGVHRKISNPAVRLVNRNGLPATEADGAWSDLPGGSRIWRLAVRSSGAAALRVHFRNFDVGAGQVWVHDGLRGGGQAQGPFTGRGIYGDGDFWSGLVHNEAAIIEYAPDPNAPPSDAVPFRILEITHIWQSYEGPLAPQGAAPPWEHPALTPGAQKITGAPRAEKANGPRVKEGACSPDGTNCGFGPSAPCHIDVTCNADVWGESAAAVARMIFEVGGGTVTCSGTLLNNRNQDFRPLFLTAAHCLNTDGVARTVETFWFFQSSQCDGTPPSPSGVPRALGARLLETLGDFGDPKGDMTLLLLNDVPNGVTFQGWDPNQVELGSRVVGIHHPRGTYKRISAGSVVPDTVFGQNDDIYALVAMNQGRIEGGSSGSALFSQPNEVIGALSYGLKVNEGQSACDFDPFPAGYTHFSVFYPNIQQHLEGDGGGDPNPPPPPDSGGGLTPGTPETFRLSPQSGPFLFNGPFSYQLAVPADVTRVTVTLETATPNVDVDLFLRFGQDTTVANGNVVADYRSISTTGNEEIVIDASSDPPLEQGTYYVSLAVFTPNSTVDGTLTATFEREATPPPGGETLISGEPVDFALPSVEGPTLFSGEFAYRIDTPENAQQLDVSLSTATAGADVDLYVRFGEPPTVEEGRVVADFSSTSLSGDELITITPDSGLQAGAYYIALAVFTENTAVSGELRADVLTDADGPDPGGALLLSSGQAGEFELPAVANPTFFSDVIFAIDVTSETDRLVVDLNTLSPGVDVDLFVRLGQPPEVSEGRVLSNYASQGLTGLEQIVIDRSSTPPLRSGRYYMGLAVFSEGLPSAGRVTATLRTGDAGPGGNRIAAVVNSATNVEGPIAPGQLISIYGVGVGPSPGISPGLDAQGLLPNAAEDTIVLINSEPAPLTFASDGQTNAQAPYSIAGQSTVRVVVLSNGRLTNPVEVAVADAAPGLFAWPGEQRAVAVNQDGSLNSPENPARRGGIVLLYGTGEGRTDPPIDEGRPVSLEAPFPRPVLPVEVRIGGVPGQVFYAGAAPGFAGLLQLNIWIDPNTPPGEQTPVELQVGGAAAPAVTIAVE